jgi:paired amphipathic helix protein Sin3a
MLPLSMMNNNVSQEPVDEDEDGEIAEEVNNVTAISGDADANANAVTDTVTSIINNDENKDVEMTDADADVSSTTPPNNNNHDTDNNNINITTQFEHPGEELVPPKPEPEQQQLQTKEEEPESSPPVQMDTTTEDTSAEDPVDPPFVTNNTATEEEENSIIAVAAPSPPSPSPEQQQNGDTAVHPFKPADGPPKGEFIAPEDAPKEESIIAPGEEDPVAAPTKPSTPMESDMVKEEDTTEESSNMVTDATAENNTTTEVSAPPTTTTTADLESTEDGEIGSEEDGEIAGTEENEEKMMTSLSSSQAETIPKVDNAAPLTTEAPLVDSGDVTEEKEKPTDTTPSSPTPTPQSQPQPLQGPGLQLGEEGAASASEEKEAEKKVDDIAVDATTNNDPVVASLDDGKEPSLATETTKTAENEVPVHEFTSKPSDENDDVEMTVEKQDEHVDMNNHNNMNNHNMNSLLSKINNSSAESASTAAASSNATQVSQQQHQQRPPSFNNFQQQQQQPISRSNSNDGVGPPGAMAGMNNNSDNALGLSTGGMPMPSINNDGKSNFFNNMANDNMNNNGGQQPERPPPPMGPMGGMRELRVEDALLYLDDVKREFGGKPRVYNEFLAIMKNFKSQEVDTPGVIARVSKLFRGNNHLILGFNKFLPDGYKISMEDLRQMDQAYAREEEILRQQQAAMAAKGQQQQHEHQQRQQFEAQMQLPQQRLLAERQIQQQLQQQQQQLPPSHMAGPLSQQLQQQQQHQQPMDQDVQMKQAQANRQRMQVAADLQEQQRQQTIPKPPKQPKQGGKAGKGRKVQQAVPPPQQQQPPQPPPQQQPQQMQQQNQPHQAVEFDHAISYVTTIKRRFANDQSTYHSFLEILHTYQKEQRGIKEVLEQVAHLFQDHPDLLKEFTFFLPDAVQEQAKERLHRAAAESESRLSAQKDKNNKQLQGGSSKEIVDMTDHPMPVDQSEARGQKRYHKDVQEAPVVISYPQTPETFVYNSAVERQFFDAAKEALASYTRDGGQAWAEFMKCLDMYAQEILSKSEMLNFVEPLLGKRNNKLFEEFKRILSAAGGQGTSTVPSMEDSWYSVPLSEIDFSRCRRCSPSYRALPRDYPAPPCSKRSDEERMVLNDVWVSLPVGSEESYTFRHMRRNTYEETLFRVEDERFEIDMTIDSNLCTLALLEPFAQEMAQLSGNDGQMQTDKENESKTNMEQKGLGGKRFRYTFDPTILGVIHRNSITRIYGDAGAEMLELLKTNPSVAIPIVVDRLRQKDVEWQKVRDRLNRHWKEMAENNYYKSLDHRSLTWRTTDKRAISNRTLLTDIKDRAANDGNESEAALQVRIDKAKEEHGLFFEVTMGNAFLQKLDLSILPKPDRRLFTPDMSLMYEDTTWVQKDAYRILSFALERGSISPTDKERCHRLWTEFLGPWFDLNLNWMLTPAVNFQETTTSSSRLPRVVSKDENSPEEDEEDSLDEVGEIDSRIVTENLRDDEHDGDDNCDDTPTHMDHHPLPAGSTVTTIYGEGRIMNCRNDIYVVKLAFGIAYLRPSAVLCSVLAAEKSAYTTQRMDDDNTKLDRPNDKLMIGTQSLYLFFRLHQILCRRIGIARKLAFEVKNDPSLQTLVEQMPGQYGSGAAAGKRRYDAFLSLVYALLDGGTGGAAEGGKFEDRVRSLLGHGGYELATMDKLISHILKNIQSMANDDTMWSLVQLFRRHLDAGGFKPEAFRQEAAYLSDGEHMYAFQLCPIHKDRGDKSVLYVENLGVIVGSEEEDSLPSDPPVEETKTKEPISKRQKR